MAHLLGPREDADLIQFNCRECKADMEALENHAGRKVFCPKCYCMMVVPGAAPSPSPTSRTETPSTENEAPRRRRSREMALIGGIIVVAIVGIGLLVSAFLNGSGNEPISAAKPAKSTDEDKPKDQQLAENKEQPPAIPPGDQTPKITNLPDGGTKLPPKVRTDVAAPTPPEKPKAVAKTEPPKVIAKKAPTEPPAPEVKVDAFLGAWKSIEDSVVVEFKINEWPKGAKEPGGTDGVGNLSVYVGRPDEKPRHLEGGMVVWTKTKAGFDFHLFRLDKTMSEADGTGVLRGDGKLLLTWGDKKTILTRDAGPLAKLDEPAKKEPPKVPPVKPEPPKVEPKERTTEVADLVGKWQHRGKLNGEINLEFLADGNCGVYVINPAALGIARTGVISAGNALVRKNASMATFISLLDVDYTLKLSDDGKLLEMTGSPLGIKRTFALTRLAEDKKQITEEKKPGSTDDRILIRTFDTNSLIVDRDNKVIASTLIDLLVKPVTLRPGEKYRFSFWPQLFCLNATVKATEFEMKGQPLGFLERADIAIKLGDKLDATKIGLTDFSMETPKGFKCTMSPEDVKKPISLMSKFFFDVDVPEDCKSVGPELVVRFPFRIGKEESYIKVLIPVKLDIGAKPIEPKAVAEPKKTNEPKAKFSADDLIKALTDRKFSQEPNVGRVKLFSNPPTGMLTYYFKNKESGATIALGRDLVEFVGLEGPGQKFDLHSSQDEKNLRPFMELIKELSPQLHQVCEERLADYKKTPGRNRRIVGDLQVFVDKFGLHVSTVPHPFFSELGPEPQPKVPTTPSKKPKDLGKTDKFVFPSAAEIEKLLEKGGEHWSAHEKVGKIQAGKDLWIWPAEDRIHSREAGKLAIKLHWSLRPGASIPNGTKIFLCVCNLDGTLLSGKKLFDYKEGTREGTVEYISTLAKPPGDQMLVVIGPPPGGSPVFSAGRHPSNANILQLATVAQPMVAKNDPPKKTEPKEPKLPPAKTDAGVWKDAKTAKLTLLIAKENESKENIPLAKRDYVKALKTTLDATLVHFRKGDFDAARLLEAQIKAPNEKTLEVTIHLFADQEAAWPTGETKLKLEVWGHRTTGGPVGTGSPVLFDLKLTGERQPDGSIKGKVTGGLQWRKAGDGWILFQDATFVLQPQLKAVEK